MADLETIKKRQQAMWASGDYSMVESTLTIIGERLCEAVDLRAGERVLDVATGSGNTARAAARRWCEVTAIDYVPSLLERGRERAAAERLPVTFKQADAENLPFPDGSFDVVLSTLGAMFAPDQEKVAKELLRVCRNDGRIGMANWTPDGLIGEIFRTIAKYVPPPPGLKPPVLWGTEERLWELFGDGVASLQANRRNFVFRYHSEDHWLDFFRTYYGPTIRAFEALGSEGKDKLAADLLDIMRRFNRSGDKTLAAPSDYLEVVARRK